MANEIKIDLPSGLNLYAVIFDATGRAWNTSGTPAFETITAGNWTSYAIALTPSAVAAIYLGTFPAAIPAGVYDVSIYARAAGTPATTDAPRVGGGLMQWGGSAEAPLSAVPGLVWTAGSRTLTAFGFAVTVSGSVVIDQSQPISTIRNQDAITAPTIADALLGGWHGGFGPETEHPSPTNTYVKVMPGGGIVLRTFTLTNDANGNPLARV